MIKLLVAEIKLPDGSMHTVKTYADERFKPRRALKEIIPLDAEIVSFEWRDTLTENRESWNKENPECKIRLNV